MKTLDVAFNEFHGGRGSAASGTTPRRPVVRARVTTHRLLLLWALLFALAWQGFVAQAHRHLNAMPSSMWTTPAAADKKSNGDQPLDTPGNCSICRELAGSGPALLPVAASVAVPDAFIFRSAAPSLHRITLVPRRHVWRSRAPPLLQA